MSLAPRPSSRTPSEITRARITFFSSDFHAGPNSLVRLANSSSPSVWARCAFASSLTADMLAWRSFRSGTSAASTLSFPKDSSASQRSCWYSGCGSKSEGFTPTSARNSSWSPMISAMTSFARSRPCATTSSVGAVAAPPAARSGQVSSGASPSIIRMSMPPCSFFEPATTMSNVASSSSWKLGFTTQSEPISPRRTAPTGPSNGSPAIPTASEAAFIAGMSYGLAMSTDRTVTTTWTSSR